MSDVWVCFPTVDVAKAQSATDKWRERGYKVALFWDATNEKTFQADYTIYDTYGGYWKSCNQLARRVGSIAEPEWIVYASDDIDPDPHTATELAEAATHHFQGTFGVFQPAGDSQGKDNAGLPAAARICGSPWFGKEWIKKAYKGKGPTWEGYRSFYGDEEIKEVAERLGVLWHAPEYAQLHRHWSWNHQPKTEYQSSNQKYWDQDRQLFFERKANNFPGHEPLEINISWSK